MNDDVISRQAAIDAVKCGALSAAMVYGRTDEGSTALYETVKAIKALPSAQPEGWVKIPNTGIDDLSDGFHTFRQLYYQRMMLFVTIVKQNKDKAWKSLRHEDGELCFGGGWFIVGIDTPEGSYTYHYEDSYFSLFDCEELERSKHWDGHTEKDVTRLLSLPSAQPEIVRCKDCKHKPVLDEDGDPEFPTERCPCQCDDDYYSWIPKDDWYCADAERRTDESD